MNNSVRIAAIIPARMASSRFPGKPLLDFRGLPMVEHVRRRALLATGFTDVVVATCDEVISDAIKKHGGRVIMTSKDHQAATDRVAEAMHHLDCTHVVNVQGDEILILPEDLDRMADAIKRNPSVSAWNGVAAIDDAAELRDRSIVKCALSTSDRVLYCSRDFSTSPLKPPAFEPIFKILGILGFERSFLLRYPELPRTPLELAESIDQSRIIENDTRLHGVRFTHGYPGINEPREVEFVEAFLQKDPRQQSVLAEILR
jgi:3-deoxy-manno-octulosonate cytidylyltransferase (CMP-KDO synthetase)